MTAPQKSVHSHADALGDGRLTAPAATRNAGPIVEALRPFLPQSGRALEIASGTGQHAVAIARACPELIWQPTDVAPERLVSIDAWRIAEGLGNIRPAARLDATAPGWHWEPVELIFLANLLHLIPTGAAAELIAGVARSLTPGGRFALYGPFRTEGGFRSEGDAAFHARLTAADPESGYKDLEWIEAEAAARGLSRRALIEMPANNLLVVFERP